MNIHKVQIHQIPGLPVEVIVCILGRGLGSRTLPFTCGRAFQASLKTLITGSWPSLVTSSLSESALQARLGGPHVDERRMSKKLSIGGWRRGRFLGWQCGGLGPLIEHCHWCYHCNAELTSGNGGVKVGTDCSSWNVVHHMTIVRDLR